MTAAIEMADGEDEAAPVNGLAIGEADRERLNAVLRDLLECKRLLERARE
jgi:hypothetical protein